MAEVGTITLPPRVSPNIVDAMNAHWDAEIIDRFALKHHASEPELLRQSRNLERFTFRQFVFSQCHSETDVAQKLDYLCGGGPGGRNSFLAALLDDDRGEDLPAAFLRSLIIAGPARAVPVLPPAGGGGTSSGE